MRGSIASTLRAAPVTDLREQLQATLGDALVIQRELGGGGMSRVFVVRDQALGRDVVVKVVSPERAEGLSAERFAREVRLAARLQQANIVPVLAAGTSGQLPYYAMPFVRGETLRARMASGAGLTTTEAISALRDVARALAYAHGEGVVHRDIKPENILLSGGAAVVTDFGIAKAIDASRSVDGAASALTGVGMSIGTPAYIAPEQALGDAATDHRADLYSWGVVAYELLAGAHPFASRTTPQALIAAHIAEVPEPLAVVCPGLPSGLASLVMRTLEKSPDKRPASANEVLAALDAVGSSAASGPSRRQVLHFAAAAFVVVALAATVHFAWRRSQAIPAPGADKSLAVMSFVAPVSDSADSFMGEGIADEVSNRLAQVPGLRLAGRTSAVRIARSGAGSVQEIAQKLGVGAVLDGTVRRVGGMIRVDVELANGADGHVIWREQYERPASDIIAVQDDIARAMAVQLQVTLSGADASGGTHDAASHELYLKGMYLFRRRGAGLVDAVSALEQATVRDSSFARAWAGLASTLMVEPNYVNVRLRDVLPRARAAAERAVRLDSTLSEAHLALGFVLAESSEWARAEGELRRAIALDPAASEPRYRLGYLLMNMRRSGEAIPMLLEAKARDPLYFIIGAFLGAARIDVGQVAAGVAEARRALNLEPMNVAALSAMGPAYTAALMPESANAVARRLLAVTTTPGRRGIAAGVLALRPTGSSKSRWDLATSTPRYILWFIGSGSGWLVALVAPATVRVTTSASETGLATLRARRQSGPSALTA